MFEIHHLPTPLYGHEQRLPVRVVLVLLLVVQQPLHTTRLRVVNRCSRS